MRKGHIALVIAAIVAAAAGIGYAAGLLPFETRGEISASDVCENLGPKEDSKKILEELLPDSSTYSFDTREGSRHTTESNFASSCFVQGEDSKLLLSARTEMWPDASSASWLEEVGGEGFPPSSTKRFDAGDAAFQSHRSVAILVPCIRQGEIPGGPYDLSVIVELKSNGVADEPEQKALRSLALATAEYAHTKARCGMPSKLP